MPFIEPSSSVEKIVNRIARSVGVDPGANALGSERIYDAIQESIELICGFRDWSFMRTSGSFTTVANTTDYDLRDDLPSLIRPMAFLDTNKKPLQFISYAIYLKSYANDSDSTAANPKIYYPVGGYTYGLFPKPSGEATVYVYYHKQHGDVTVEGASLELPSYLHPAVAQIAKRLYLADANTNTIALLNDPAIIMYIQQAAARDEENTDIISPEIVEPQGVQITTTGTGSGGLIEAP